MTLKSGSNWCRAGARCFTLECTAGKTHVNKDYDHIMERPWDGNEQFNTITYTFYYKRSVFYGQPQYAYDFLISMFSRGNNIMKQCNFLVYVWFATSKKWLIFIEQTLYKKYVTSCLTI